MSKPTLWVVEYKNSVHGWRPVLPVIVTFWKRNAVKQLKESFNCKVKGHLFLRVAAYGRRET